MYVNFSARRTFFDDEIFIHYIQMQVFVASFLQVF